MKSCILFVILRDILTALFQWLDPSYSLLSGIADCKKGQSLSFQISSGFRQVCSNNTPDGVDYDSDDDQEEGC